MDKEKLGTIIYLFVLISGSILVGTFVLIASLQHDFNQAMDSLNTTFKAREEGPTLIEQPYELSIFPWSKYHKHSTRELSDQELTFLQEKKVAECMVDMVNYDIPLIQDKENAISLLYSSARRLITDDDREYYVWYEIPVENIYIFSMVNMSGQLFTFRYVTDLESDGQEALEYVLDSYKNNESVHSFDSEFSDFENNRDLFTSTVRLKLLEYNNVNIQPFYESVNLKRKPTQIAPEGGNILMRFLTVAEDNSSIFLYFDSKTRKFSGYHLMLY